MKKYLIAACLTLTSMHAMSEGRFSVTSPDLTPGKTVPDKFIYKGFQCEGGNVSPALKWSNPPKGTKSFVVNMYDPDAPTGSGWWHWVVFNIPADVLELKQGAGDPKSGLAPAGVVQGRTDFGNTGWGGPCPPKGSGKHRYEYNVYALKVDKLDLDENASPALIGFMTRANAIGKATLRIPYGRK